MNKDILHAPLPKGPAGQFGFHLLQSNMLMKYSKNQDAAKEFLKWIHAEANYEKFFDLAEGLCHAVHGQVGVHMLWDVDPVMAPFKVAARLGQALGFAGPPNAKAQEVLSSTSSPTCTPRRSRACRPRTPSSGPRASSRSLRLSCRLRSARGMSMAVTALSGVGARPSRDCGGLRTSVGSRWRCSCPPRSCSACSSPTRSSKASAEALGSENFSGSDATSASRNSLGNANPIVDPSRERER